MKNQVLVLAAAVWMVSWAASCSSTDSQPAEDVQTGDLSAHDPDVDALSPGTDSRVEDQGGEDDTGMEVGRDLSSEATEDTAVEPHEDPGVRLRREQWLRGDLHMHTHHSDGDDPLPMVIELAEYLESDVFLAFHPEYEGNGLDFISLTDHNTLAQIEDPDHVSHRLILIPGIELTGNGHANAFGVPEEGVLDYVYGPGSHAAWLDTFETLLDADAVVSLNHPFTLRLFFAFDIRNHHSIEIWNTRWGLGAATLTPEDLDAWEAKHGQASPAFRKALQFQGIGGNHQALKFYEAQLTMGLHVAVVGGSDRHALFPVGFPTTWVHSASDSVEGVLQGIRDRHTFVSRTPVAATVEMGIKVPGGEYRMGDKVWISDVEEAEFVVRVGRSKGGIVRLIRGSTVGDPEDLQQADLGHVAFEEFVTRDDETFRVRFAVEPGDWFYPMVMEALIPEGLDPELAQRAPKVASLAALGGSEDYGPIVEALMDFVDLNVILSPQYCDPELWDPSLMQCMPPDTNGVATFFFPDWLDRALNVIIEDGTPSQWSMGAVGSAVVFDTKPR
jgi:hypothetical protein